VTTVVDASVLVAATADAGPEGIWAEGLVGDGPLAAPHLVLAEATNILRRFELTKRLTPLEAASARRDLLQLDIHLIPFEPLADRIWELRSNLTCYDAWYVAVAEALDLPLATLDRRLAGATGPTCRFLIPT
jgi:predicted nucleic acid-binding protein